jgi:cysteine synthase
VARGALKPGGTIVEGTAGNTGIGLALVGASMGFRTVIVIPETQSQEKKDMLRLAGAELVEVPAAPYRNPNNYVRYSGRLAEELAKTEPNGAIWANQFDNTANRQAHVETTGPEIWEQTGGKVDGFICAVGSGGTLAGVAMALQPKGVKIGLADPDGAALYSFYTTGELKAEGSSITEGIGQGRITANLEGFTPDFAYRIPDAEALPIVFDLLEHEGLCLGGSSGINIAGAIRMAREMGPGHTIVTILCDYGTRYQSKLFNPAFLRDKGLPVPGGWTALRATCRICASLRTERSRTGEWPVHRVSRHCASDRLCRWCGRAFGACCAGLSAPLPRTAMARPRAPTTPLGGDGRSGRNPIETAHAPDTVLEALRAEITGFRSTFIAAQNQHRDRIETLREQIAALGPPPGEGEVEAPEIAERGPI